jgi:hypothetical protein
MKPEGPRLFVFNSCRQFIWTVPLLPGDETDMDNLESDAEDHVGGLGFAFETWGESWFRSRSMCRFPCGTKGVGIVTQYLGEVFGESRGG